MCQCRNKTSDWNLCSIRSDLYQVSLAAFCSKKWRILISPHNLLICSNIVFLGGLFSHILSSLWIQCRKSADASVTRVMFSSERPSTGFFSLSVHSHSSLKANPRLDVPDNGAAVALQLWVIRARSRKACVCLCVSELFRAPHSWKWYHG